MHCPVKGSFLGVNGDDREREGDCENRRSGVGDVFVTWLRACGTVRCASGSTDYAAPVNLRPYGEGDAALTVALETDPVVKRHLGGVLTPDGAAAVHRERMAGIARGDRFWVVEAPGPAGVVGIWATPWDGGILAEIGWMLLPGFHGRGLGRQAAAVVLHLHGDGEQRALHAFPATDNPASNAICRSLGFHRVDDVDLDYAGRPLRCAHWVTGVRSASP